MNKRSYLSPKNSKSRCNFYRKEILKISQSVPALHIAPAFSCIEICDLIYNHLIKWKNSKPDDVFLMSKGHGCMIQYVILKERKLLTEKDLKFYCKPNGRLGAHPDYGVPGIEASTGSLGHGMGISVGMAFADMAQKRKNLVYLVLSDGECQEGSTWEAAMMAGNLKLSNLIAFVDMNDFSGLERMSEGHPAFHPLSEKFESFGWEVYEVDGHSTEKMKKVILNRRNMKKPLVIICKTIKGKGVSYMENVPIWHYRSPSKDEFILAMKELNEK